MRPILFLIFTGEDENYFDINICNDIYINYKSKLNIIYMIGICIEILHSLSLVLDDLPEMDNDNIRRDNLSFHTKYGSDYTNFFIYYMFNHIGLELDNCNNFFYENETKNTINITTNITTNINDKKYIELNYKIMNDIQYIIKKNINYLIEGQYEDLAWTSNDSDESQESQESQENIIHNFELLELKRKKINNIIFLNEKDIIFNLLNINNNISDIVYSLDKLNQIELNIDLNMKKTSSLFNLSITTGYMLQLWKNNINYLNNEKYIKVHHLLSIFSNILGYMFQLSDDVLDIESDKIKNNPNIAPISLTNLLEFFTFVLDK